MMNVPNRQSGLTITELMVALAIGLVVTAAVAGLFLQTSSSNTQNEQIGYLQDNGRYALKVLAEDLKMSSYWGGMSVANRISIGIDNNTSAVANIAANLDITSATGCGTSQKIGATPSMTNWDYDLTFPLHYRPTTTTATVAGEFPCIDDIAPGETGATAIDADTDVFIVKRIRGQSFDTVASLDIGGVYIRTNRSTASLHQYIDANTTDPASGYYDWPYLVHIYFIENQQLKRWALKKDSATPANNPIYYKEVLADGIEKYRIVFGIDNSNPTDGNVDFYTSNPTDAQLQNAVAARIYVLARGSKEIVGYNNDKSYQLGDLPVAATGDRYYRRVFETTVILKNIENVLEQ